MANSLLITKLSDGSFSFVVNGDIIDTIINLRNDMTNFGNEAHFKTSNGANLIKLQQVLYNEVTIVNGATLPVASSGLDLRIKLRSVGFWDWMDAGSGTGVDRFDDLLDTFSYFGNDGKVPIVDESQLKLIPYTIPDTSYLDLFPNPLVALKGLRVNSLGTEYELYDVVNLVTQTILLGNTTTSPSEDAVFKALDLKANKSDVVSVPKIEFIADGIQNDFDTTSLATVISVFWNSAQLRDGDFSQVGSIITLSFIPSSGDIIKPI